MDKNISWTFRKHHPLDFGSKLFISGSIAALGNWNLHSAIPMTWTEGNNWQATVILLPQPLEYKFVTEDFKGKKTWETTPNRILDFRNQKLYEKKLTLMSFNIRFDTNTDKQFAWKHRKDFAVEKLLEHFPSVIGVQQALKHQKVFLCEKLHDYYDYFGVARDLKDGEECGVFYLRHRFRILDHKFVWFNETRTPGVLGFGADFPRKLTYLLMEDTQLKVKFALINTHLDHMSAKSQRQSVKIILQTIKSVAEKDKVEDFFIMGDFNIQESNPSLTPLYESQFKFLSARRNSKVSDLFPTFHSFKGEQMMEKVKKGEGDKGWPTIDHVFYSSRRFQPEEFRVLVTGKPYMSDHYPVYATFGVK